MVFLLEQLLFVVMERIVLVCIAAVLVHIMEG
jgi:hypothetical protein